jgi:hypothetical protein
VDIISVIAALTRHSEACEISSSHGGEYDVQTRQYNPEDSSEHHTLKPASLSFCFLTLERREGKGSSLFRK